MRVVLPCPRVVSTKQQSITGSFSIGVLAPERQAGSTGSMDSGVLLILFEPRTATCSFVSDCCFTTAMRHVCHASKVLFFCFSLLGDSEISSCIRHEGSYYVQQSLPMFALCDSVLPYVVVSLSSWMSSCRLCSCFDLVQFPYGRFAWLGWGW